MHTVQARAVQHEVPRAVVQRVGEDDASGGVERGAGGALSARTGCEAGCEEGEEEGLCAVGYVVCVYVFWELGGEELVAVRPDVEAPVGAAAGGPPRVDDADVGCGDKALSAEGFGGSAFGEAEVDVFAAACFWVEGLEADVVADAAPGDEVGGYAPWDVAREAGGDAEEVYGGGDVEGCFGDCVCDGEVGDAD